MSKHFKILAGIYIFIGALLMLSVAALHLKIFSIIDFNDYSVMSGDFGVARFYEKYVYLLGVYGVDLTSVLTVLLTIFSSVAFGVGILRRRRWAAYLGFALALVGIIGTVANFSTNGFAVSALQILLSGYTFWVVSSEELKKPTPDA